MDYNYIKYGLWYNLYAINKLYDKYSYYVIIFYLHEFDAFILFT